MIFSFKLSLFHLPAIPAETLTAGVISLTASQTATQQMLKDLIAAMAREHTDGKH